MAEWVQMIVPMLVCTDSSREIKFCKTAFGAQELSCRTDENGRVIHATLGIGSFLIMIHCETRNLASRAPHPDASSPVVIYLYLKDVDSAVEKAIAAGARIITSLKDQPWGDRMARIVDPAGHVWNIASRVE